MVKNTSDGKSNAGNFTAFGMTKARDELLKVIMQVQSDVKVNNFVPLSGLYNFVTICYL